MNYVFLLLKKYIISHLFILIDISEYIVSNFSIKWVHNTLLFNGLSHFFYLFQIFAPPKKSHILPE